LLWLAHHAAARLHRDCSRDLIQLLAKPLRSDFAGHTPVLVLSEHCSDNRDRFGLN